MDFSSPSPTGSSSSVGMVPFGFHSKTNYDANESLIQIRSDNFTKNIPLKEDDIWKRPPPDFRPQIFAPKPPKRNTQDSQMPWLYGTIPGQREIIKRERPKVIPHLLQTKDKDNKGLVTYFHIDRPFTAKKKFVREGMNEPGEYVNPTPHDYRGVFNMTINIFFSLIIITQFYMTLCKMPDCYHFVSPPLKSRKRRHKDTI